MMIDGSIFWNKKWIISNIFHSECTNKEYVENKNCKCVNIGLPERID